MNIFLGYLVSILSYTRLTYLTFYWFLISFVFLQYSLLVYIFLPLSLYAFFSLTYFSLSYQPFKYQPFKYLSLAISDSLPGRFLASHILIYFQNCFKSSVSLLMSSKSGKSENSETLFMTKNAQRSKSWSPSR